MLAATAAIAIARHDGALNTPIISLSISHRSSTAPTRDRILKFEKWYGRQTSRCIYICEALLYRRFAISPALTHFDINDIRWARSEIDAEVRHSKSAQRSTKTVEAPITLQANLVAANLRR